MVRAPLEPALRALNGTLCPGDIMFRHDVEPADTSSPITFIIYDDEVQEIAREKRTDVAKVLRRRL